MTGLLTVWEEECMEPLGMFHNSVVNYCNGHALKAAKATETKGF